MVNYNSVDDIITAGVTNASVLIDNTAYDDNAYTASGASWLIYNDTACNNIYVSGNTWFGFGSNSEHLRVNRQDAKMWYLWREEGTLFNYYKFLKFRWSGYSYYSQTSSAYKLTYDVILFDTGDIFLHMVDIPTSNWDGTFQLVASSGTFSYTKPTIANPIVTFYKQSDKKYEIKYEAINLLAPYDRKYLIYDDTTQKYYNVVDESLNELSITELTAESFKTYGVDTPPVGSLLIALQKPKLLYWQDSEDALPVLKALVKAIPPAQTIVTDDIDISDSTITGIEKLTAEYTGDPRIACSFNGGTTWKVCNGAEWVVLSEDAIGMTIETLLGITSENWNTTLNGLNSFKMRFTLATTGDTLTNIHIQFTN